jgi:hypothetical protein
MADSNIKKVVINKIDLPPIDANNFSYNIRYRLISEDKNRTSHWSRIHNIDATDQAPGTFFDYSYFKEVVSTGTGTTTAIRLNWIVPTTYAGSTFDIFVKRNAGAYSYYATSFTNNYVILRESTETSITILVQMPTYPKVQTASAKLFETVAITVP